MHTIDLALGSRAGTAFVEKVNPALVRGVLAADGHIADRARQRGMQVFSELPGGDCLLSVHWPRIFPMGTLSAYRLPLNLHPGYLPYARGMYPVFWAVFEGRTAGATIHVMTSRLDFGPIIRREAVPYDARATGGEVWQRVFDVEMLMALEVTEQIFGGESLEACWIDEPVGPVRSLADFERLKRRVKDPQLSTEERERLSRALNHHLYPS